jgi:uncharacterized protein YgbK (DUF1537 family)
MLIGAIADDLTGAGDLALMFARGGLSVVQTVGVPTSAEHFGGAEAVVVSLKSRTIAADDAVPMSLASGRVLLEAGAQQLFFKYCSTFDSTEAGNIGPVAEALMGLVGATGTIACPAFPANRRTVYRGHLFVGDQLLSESSMKDHPLTPMRDANLVRVLAWQTQMPVSLIPREVVAGPPDALAAAFTGIEGIAIVDAIADSDLRAIGAAAKGMALVTGGSGIALGLPANFGRRPGDAPAVRVAPAGGGAVMLAGSCSVATRRQVAAAIAAGTPALKLDPVAIATGAVSLETALAFVAGAAGGPPPLVYSSAEPDAVAAAQARLGPGAGALVEDFLSRLAAALLARGTTRFVVAGGETSGAVVEALGVSAMRIGPEIDPGVPWALTTGTDRPLALALKSGNFGGEDFFLRAWTFIE